MAVVIDRAALFDRLWWEEGPPVRAFYGENKPGAHELGPQLRSDAAHKVAAAANGEDYDAG